MSPVSPVFHIVESVGLSFHSKTTKFLKGYFEKGTGLHWLLCCYIGLLEKSYFMIQITYKKNIETILGPS